MTCPDPDPVAAVLLRVLGERAGGRSVCPTEVARAIAGAAGGEAWRGQLGAVRRVALRLAEAGAIEILRKGKPVAPEAARGVIRLRLRGTDAP